MGIVIYDEERFTENAKKNLEHFIYYVNGNEIAGMVSERCVVYAKGGLSQEEALASIRNARKRKAVDR